MTAGHGCPLLFRGAFVCVLLFSMFSVQSAEFRIVGGLQTTPDQAPFLAALLQRNKTLQVAGVSLPAQVFSDSSNLSFEAPLSHCGYGLAPCANAQGKACVIARGTNTFAEKVANCAVSGGVAVLIYNYFDTVFLGVVGREQALPVFALSSLAGDSLLSNIGEVATYGYGEKQEDAAFFCGGSYLGDGWVLTAAHCVTDREAVDLQVAFGSGDYRDGRELYSVDTVHPHAGFTASGVSLGKDVALLLLTDVPEQVEAIALADWDDQRKAIDAADIVQVYGRGEDEVVAPGGVAGSSRISNQAFVADIPLVDINTCASAMLGEPLESDMLCAGNQAGVGTCFGDSGGPLLWHDNGQDKLLGVISWGVGCGLEGYYDVFASVASYRDSLQGVMSGDLLELDGVSVPAIVRIEDEEVVQDPLESGGGGSVGFIWILMVLRFAKHLCSCSSLKIRTVS